MKILIFLLLGLSAVLQVSAGNHRLTSIRVTGNWRASDVLVTDQSRLKEGETYSDREIMYAVRRVAQLPFIYGADYRLDDAKDGGKVLTIRVYEQRRYQAAWATEYLTDGDYDLWDDDLELSVDWFPGSGHIGLILDTDPEVTQDHEDLDKTALVYEHYNIGRGVQMRLFLNAFGTVRDRVALGDGYRSDSDIPFNELGIEFVFPLDVNNSIAVQLARSDDDEATRLYIPGGIDRYNSTDTISGELRAWWVSDTRDDEIAPLDGRLYRLGVFHRTLSADYLALDFNTPGSRITQEGDGDTQGAFGEFGFHDPLWGQGSLSVSSLMTWEETDLDFPWDPESYREEVRGIFEIAYTWDLSGRNQRSREHLIKAIVAREYRYIDSSFGDDDIEGGVFGGSYTYRDRRFRVKLTALYSP
ncbi:MAG: hypothetical protein QNK37_02750 [Acidobacteriota bacterium]|nr:hypothetical protein [Acidobacteriota bacterium]